MHAGCDLDAETHATKITACEHRPGAGMSYFIEDRLALWPLNLTLWEGKLL